MAKKNKKEKKKTKDHERMGMAIPAGLFIGLGIGLLTGQVAAYTVIGLGAGFLFAYLIVKK